MARSQTSESAITAECLAYGTTSLSSPRVDARRESEKLLYYLESDHNGHGRIKRVGDAPGISVTPDRFNVGSSINGYGGGAFAIQADGRVVFVDATTHGVYLATTDRETIDTIVVQSEAIFGDLAAHPIESHSIVAIREIKSPSKKYPEISIVSIDTQTSVVTTLREGADFFTHPRFSLDGKRLCWLEWNRPHMPWTGARLYSAIWTGTGVSNIHRVGNHYGCGQPRWCSGQTLLYAHDETGFQQLYRARSSEIHPQWLRIAGLESCEFAGAEFWLSSNTYMELEEGTMVVAYTSAGSSKLALVDYDQRVYLDLNMDLNDIAYDAMQRIDRRSFLVIGASATQVAALYRVELPDRLEFGRQSKQPCQAITLAQSFDMASIPKTHLSTPIPITFPRSPPSASIKSGHAFLMEPSRYLDNLGDVNRLPPCILFAHGGPTKHHRPSINLESQYFTSRGYAVVLLNHVGSTGYGSAYRDAMDGQWGVEDVQDAVDCIHSLAMARIIDPKRVGITGGSAGGYLTLQAICTRPDVWSGAVSLCGIADMSGFARTSHKFESCYDYLLIRGRSSLSSKFEDGSANPQIPLSDATDSDGRQGMLKQLYNNRSPIRHVHRLRTPVLLLQGADDSVVTADQATHFIAAVEDHQRVENISHGQKIQKLAELVMYQKEGHGFHLAKTKQDSLIQQEKWWQKTLGK